MVLSEYPQASYVDSKEVFGVLCGNHIINVGHPDAEQYGHYSTKNRLHCLILNKN